MLKMLFILLAVLIVIGTVALICLERKRRQREKKNQEDQLRIHILNQTIKNNMHKEAATPFHTRKERSGKNRQKCILRLSFGRKKGQEEYILDPGDPVLLGSWEEATLQLQGEGVAPKQCELFMYQSDVYLKNWNPLQNTYLQRKHKKICVDQIGVRICTGDQIIIGNYCIQADLLNIAGRELE